MTTPTTNEQSLSELIAMHNLANAEQVKEIIKDELLSLYQPIQPRSIPPKKDKIPAEWIYRPIMYAWIVFSDNNKRTYYSYELIYSLDQIANGYKKVELDFQKGFDGLVKMINKYKGSYKKARIYGLRNSAELEGTILREYKPDGSYEDKKKVSFNDESKWIDHKEKVKKEIADNMNKYNSFAHYTSQNHVIKKKPGIRIEVQKH